MKFSLLATVFLLMLPVACMAESGEARPLGVVFDSSPNIIKGRIFGSGVGSCGLKKGPQSFYMLRVSETLKGKDLSGDIKLCGGTAPFLMTNEYIVSGVWSANNEFIFNLDGLIIWFPPHRYYRLISYASPIVSSSRGDAYAVAIEEDHFVEKFSNYLDLSNSASGPVPGPWYVKNSTGKPTVSAEQKAQCVNVGGKVERTGLHSYACVYPATDAGKTCTDSSQCQSLCMTSVGTPAGTRASGTCSARVNGNPTGNIVEGGYALGDGVVD